MAILHFVTHVEDTLGLEALEMLSRANVPTTVLKGDELAPTGTVALFGIDATNPKSTTFQWPSAHVRVAAHRLGEWKPSWAITTPFCVMLRRNPNSRKDGGMRIALLQITKQYEDWFKGETGLALPWETVNGPHTRYGDLMEEWFDQVASNVTEETLQAILTSKYFPKKLRGRGGDVVFHQLAEYGRVISNPGLPDGLKTNTVYQQVSGFTQPVVVYGTSDVANLFELLQNLRSANYLGLPAVFETYPSAHNMSYWFEGFLNPSLKVLGTSLQPYDMGLKETDRYTQVISDSRVHRAFENAGLNLVAQEAAHLADCSFAQWYQNGMKLVATEFLDLVGASVPFSMTTTEELAKASGMWEWKAQELAKHLHEASGHHVVAFNKPDGTQLQTSDVLPDKTIGQLHEEDGWWLGGAAIYDLIYGLGRFGGLVVMVKDSTAGRVNLLARQYMKDPSSGLHVMPVGLFRLTSEGQNEDWSIDPWVFLEILRRWGPEKATEECQKIWNAMEVPLARSNIGNKTVAIVGLKGVTIKD